VDLKGRVAVVTGGASGIGRAMCLAFARHGAAAVVVADIDGDGAKQVAADVESIGPPSLSVDVDVSDAGSVLALVEHSEKAFGPIDLFCANAGILVVGGIDVPDEQWDRAWNVNVKSHIYAARAVLPSMMARGEGYLLHTASAAGLLTQLGAAPYSVSKHAVVSLAEWMSITYADAGIKVSCLCPQAVRTDLAANSGLGRPAARPTSAAAGSSQAARDGVLEPDDVAEVVIAGLADERFLILPHAEVETYERRRAEDRERWLRGMRRVQSQMSGRR
jgi:NAD(P)-dependent dehydrogenase (short-subunit alcohol dehydrogenase family)